MVSLTIMDWPLLGGVGAFLFVVFAVIAAWQKHIENSERKQTVGRLQDAKDRGAHKATSQYPQINPFLCIGCGSCIAACPEEGVLGLVDGMAHVIHGSRCVGHARCELACPVGAIKVGLGDIASRPDIPILNQQFETTIPGIFIAGELSGIALIRHAIDQGSRTINHIAHQLKTMPPKREASILDVCIIGAGPAGLAASLKATELGLRYKTIDQEDIGGTIRKYPRRKLTLVQRVDVPLFGALREREYEKEELIKLWTDLIHKHALSIQTHTQLLSVKKSQGVFEIQTSQGPLHSHRLVLALGRRGTPRKLGVPGEEQEKVLYQLLDTASFTGQHILVVGGGDSAIEAATGLANQSGNKVTLSYRKENFTRIKSRNESRIKDYVANRRLAMLLSSEVREIQPDFAVLEINTNNPSQKKLVKIQNNFVFVFAGGDPPFPLLKSIGIGFGGSELPSTLRVAS